MNNQILNKLCRHVLVCNRWRTPDGTLLESKYNHDFVLHTDANGDTYFVDGGNGYIRRTDNKIPMKDECLYADDDFEILRKHVLRGTFASDGTRIWIPLYKMSNEHLINCIIYNIRLVDNVNNLPYNAFNCLYIRELFYRKTNKIFLGEYEYDNSEFKPEYVCHNYCNEAGDIGIVEQDELGIKEIRDNLEKQVNDREITSPMTYMMLSHLVFCYIQTK